MTRSEISVKVLAVLTEISFAHRNTIVINCGSEICWPYRKLLARIDTFIFLCWLHRQIVLSFRPILTSVMFRLHPSTVHIGPFSARILWILKNSLADWESLVLSARKPKFILQIFLTVNGAGCWFYDAFNKAPSINLLQMFLFSPRLKYLSRYLRFCKSN